MPPQIVEQAALVGVEDQFFGEFDLREHFKRRRMVLHARLKVRVGADDDRHAVLFAAERDLPAVRDVRRARLERVRIDLDELVAAAELRDHRLVIIAVLGAAAVADDVDIRVVRDVHPKLRALLDRRVLKALEPDVVDRRDDPVHAPALLINDVERAREIEHVRLHAREQQHALVQERQLAHGGEKPRAGRAGHRPRMVGQRQRKEALLVRRNRHFLHGAVGVRGGQCMRMQICNNVVHKSDSFKVIPLKFKYPARA